MNLTKECSTHVSLYKKNRWPLKCFWQVLCRRLTVYKAFCGCRYAHFFGLSELAVHCTKVNFSISLRLPITNLVLVAMINSGITRGWCLCQFFIFSKSFARIWTSHRCLQGEVVDTLPQYFLMNQKSLKTLNCASLRFPEAVSL